MRLAVALAILVFWGGSTALAQAIDIGPLLPSSDPTVSGRIV